MSGVLPSEWCGDEAAVRKGAGEGVPSKGGGRCQGPLMGIEAVGQLWLMPRGFQRLAGGSSPCSLGSEEPRWEVMSR